jgi:sugar lactone lactonase YvrE
MKHFSIALFILILPSASRAQFSNIEAIEYDPVNGRFLVSNVANIQIADGIGNAIGQFGTTAKASYGMEVMNNALFAIGANGVVRAYDITSGVEVSSITIPGAQFLNGMASDGESRIWVTDFGARKIHEIDFSNMTEPQSTVVVTNTITTPNGICYDELNNRLVFANWGTNAAIKAVDLDNYSVTTVVNGTGVNNIDGIDNDSNGNFFISSWSPTARITKYTNDFSESEVITVFGLSSPADICYAREIDTLAIPNAGNSTVKYVGFSNTVRMDELKDGEFHLNVYPNPTQNDVYVQFELPDLAHAQLSILDANGKEIERVFSNDLIGSRHTMVVPVQHLSSGSYMLQLEVGGMVYVKRFMRN